MLLETWISRHFARSSSVAACRRGGRGLQGGEALRHAEACECERRAAPRLPRAGRGGASWLIACIGLTVAALALPQPCSAEEEDTPSIVGYAFEGFGTGLATGLAAGYLATGPKFEGGEWRTLLWGGGIGALSGLGVGLVLGIVDAGSAPGGRGVGFYILRDSNYGYGLGALTGGIVGALIWAGGGVSKDLLQGIAWGTVIGAGAGLILGVVEGALRQESTRNTTAHRRGLQLSLGFTPTSHGAPMPYPSLSGRF